MTETEHSSAIVALGVPAILPADSQKINGIKPFMTELPLPTSSECLQEVCGSWVQLHAGFMLGSCTHLQRSPVLTTCRCTCRCGLNTSSRAG